MELTTYTYSIENAFPNAKVDGGSLDEEIGVSNIKIALSGVISADGYCDIIFKDVLDGYDKPILDEVVSLHSGEPIDEISLVMLDEQRDSEGRLKFVSEFRVGSNIVVSTHNFCDPTTWYSESIRINDEALVEEDGYWSSAHINWIDVTHGKLLDENKIFVGISHEYKIVITVDGYEKIQREEFETTGGDYEVNFVSGEIAFFEDQLGKDIKASYSCENGYAWILAPKPGKKIVVEGAEAQFSDDMIFCDIIHFSAYAYNPYDMPNKVKVDDTVYKTIANFIDESRGSYPGIPPIGGSAQGTVNDTYGFPFAYTTVKVLDSSYGLELRASLRHNRALGGTRATATFYCTIVDA